MELFKYKQPIKFMGFSKTLGILSIILVLSSWALVTFKGFNYGIDFAGGTQIQVLYKGEAPLEKIRIELKKHKEYESANVKTFGSNKEVAIRIKTSSSSVDKDTKKEMATILKDTGDLEVRSVSVVGSSIGAEFRNKGLMALLYSIIGILLYISIRFEWRFAVASVIALVHDVSIAAGAIVLFGVEVDLNILAALLTILGYSLNDTVIVFDRIREGIRKIKNPDLTGIINESVTRTLSRTTLTSLTTFFVVLTLYLFGGETISGFSFTLLVGVIVGTYSSIFIASPILIWLGFNVRGFRTKEAEKLKREKEKEKMRAQYEQGTL